MPISATDVKNLRDKTGAGMMDCKKALTEAGGDMAKAEKILKEMGLAAVAKRQDRATENGRCFALVKGDKAVLLSLSCETDFVAKNDDFKKLGDELCDLIIDKNYKEMNDELKGKVDALIAIIKENMNVSKFDVFDIPSDGYATAYIHGDGNVACIIVLSAKDKKTFENDEVKALAHDLALHAAAYKPQFLNEEAVSKEYKDEQIDIFKKQVEGDPKTAAKPEKVKEGIVNGKLSKLYKEVCFEDQAFVKDDSKAVKDVLKETSKKVGDDIKIAAYGVYQAGVK